MSDTKPQVLVKKSFSPCIVPETKEVEESLSLTLFIFLQMVQQQSAVETYHRYSLP